jgi:hypothetical protein
MCHEHDGGLEVGDWKTKLGQSGFRGSDMEVCCGFAESGSMEVGSWKLEVGMDVVLSFWRRGPPELF